MVYFEYIALLTKACLIVEVRDHRPRGQPVSTTSRGPFITPSQNTNSTPAPPTVQSKEKEPPRVYRTLLRPTEQSLWQDFGPLAEASQGEFTDWMGLQVEGGLMVPLGLFYANILVGNASPARIRPSASGNVP